LINQTTAGQIITFPSPTTPALGQKIVVIANSSASFTAYNSIVLASKFAIFVWNGMDF